LEAWTCAFSVPSTGSGSGSIRIYSGGDDGKLRLVELETLSTDAEDSEVSIVRTIPHNIFKGHEAGVTAILPLSTGSEGLGDLLLTGSYDDYVRVYTTYDIRSNARNTSGKALAELKIGGGVWRLKSLNSQLVTQGEGGIRLRVLASCMHAGARILEVRRGQDGEWSIEILGSVTVHESMCYGSDVQPGEEDMNAERLCVSTSFYDRLVCVWRFDPKAV
jgi:diphthamide biosynthesis protein 7